MCSDIKCNNKTPHTGYFSRRRSGRSLDNNCEFLTDKDCYFVSCAVDGDNDD